MEQRPAPSGRGHSYHLTPAGEDLWAVCEALGTWGARWLEIAPEQLDPHVVLWSMSRLIDEGDLPHERLVIRFDISDQVKRNRFWMVPEPGHREVCLKNPGYPESLLLTTDSEALAHWHMGWLPLHGAMRDGRIKIEGQPRLVRDFLHHWQGLSVFAHVRPEHGLSADPAR